MKQRQKQNGYTLLEALMAMSILGIAAAGVLLPFISAASVQQEATDRVLAAKLASDRMEEIQNAAYSYIPSYAGTEAEGEVKNALGVEFSDSVYARFSRSVVCETVTVETGEMSAEMVLVTVTVSCDGREMITLESLIGP